MLWFLASSTVLLAAALAIPVPNSRWRRRSLESAAILVAMLPGLRWSLEAAELLPPISYAAVLPVASHPSLAAFLLFGWLAGVTIGLVRLVFQMARVLMLRRSSLPLSAMAAAQVADILRLTPPIVTRHFRTCLQTGTPMVLPTLPATVLLPAGWPSWQSRLQASALRHEWHHVRHGDAFWHGLMHLFRIALWFHPLAWVLASRWSDECERWADRAAVGVDDPADYASDLLSLILPSSRTLAFALGFLGSGKTRFHRRIESLFKAPAASSSQPAGTSVPATTLLLLLVLALGCAWTGARRTADSALRQEAELRMSAEAFPSDS
ncbi:MAG: M56 family metallopeptidase [Prosthecobacter sp.]|nr:M56 family metallopeptidase [Prosthecobacter sp.]